MKDNKEMKENREIGSEELAAAKQMRFASICGYAYFGGLLVYCFFVIIRKIIYGS